MAKAKNAVGSYGERLACRALVEAGFSVLARNWRCRDGEIDIVANDGDAVVFCEVKTRRCVDFGSPAEAVNLAKQRRLRRLAALWLSERDGPWVEIRFDVICVVLPRKGAAIVEHLKGVLV